MNQSNKVKIVVFVPESHSDIVRDAMSKAGAGKIGNYTNCSFSCKGIGRFKPGEGAHPTIGKIDKLELVVEERIEAVCDRIIYKEVIKSIKEVHPYEEVALDVFVLEEI